MKDRLAEYGARWRAAQPPPPGLDLDRVTGAARSGRPRWRLVVAAVAVVVTGTSVGAVLLQEPPASPALGPDGLRLAGNVQPVRAGSTGAQDIARGQSLFGLELLARRCSLAPTDNDVLSPGSAALALGMLSAGARGETRTAIDRLLHRPTGTGVLAAQQAQTQALRGLTQLQVSNHVYAQDRTRPQQDVLDELATAFAADLRLVDFARAPEQATDRINSDVEQDTRGLISRLFDQPLDSSTVTVLTNALHLQAPWRQDFAPATPAPFTTGDGRQVQVPMMGGQDQPGQRRDSGGWTSVTVPYDADELEAVVLLPPPDRAGSCTLPTGSQLTELTTGPSLPSGVDLPRLDLDQRSELTGTLAEMGLPLHGDYSALGGGSVSQVLQKTVLEVDEQGTTAAAATGVVTRVSAPVTPRADRPFVLVIQDTATKTPLFLARVSDPTVGS